MFENGCFVKLQIIDVKDLTVLVPDSSLKYYIVVLCILKQRVTCILYAGEGVATRRLIMTFPEAIR